MIHSVEHWANVYAGDVRESLRAMPAASVQCVVTSPPYWGLRDYGVAGQIGLESSPAEYISAMVEVFREVRRVLRPDGCLWLNIGDSYCANKNGNRDTRSSTLTTRRDGTRKGDVPATGRITRGFNKGNVAAEVPGVPHRGIVPGFKPKNLIGMPWRIAIALQDDGWYLRSEIIWHKPNPMPESAPDRPGRSHEQLFLLTPRARYFYDLHAFREAISAKTLTVSTLPRKGDGVESAGEKLNGWMESKGGRYHPEDRSVRTVWRIASEPLKLKHFAAFPVKLPQRCILLSTSERGCCPECGTPYRRQVKKERVATRPGSNSKIRHPSNWAANADVRGSALDTGAIRESVERLGRASQHEDSPYQHHNGSIVGNRDIYRHVTRVVTVGWKPACECNAGDPVPCRVLDPFHGSGATGIACDRLGRHYVGCELNPEYLPFFEQRLEIDRRRRATKKSNQRKYTVGQADLFGAAS